jgi:hypothetical protein
MARGRETIYALVILFFSIEMILLFFEVDVAKEYRNLRKWTKKMSKNQHARNTFGKIRCIYIINGPKGLNGDGAKGGFPVVSRTG